jgi:hypothetical protein
LTNAVDKQTAAKVTLSAHCSLPALDVAGLVSSQWAVGNGQWAVAVGSRQGIEVELWTSESVLSDFKN